MSVSYEPEDADRRRAQWERFQLDVPLDVIDSPYRDLTGPVIDYVDKIDKRWASDVVTVIIPELVVRRWWQQLLHNQSALWLRSRLLFRGGTVVTSGARARPRWRTGRKLPSQSAAVDGAATAGRRDGSVSRLRRW